MPAHRRTLRSRVTGLFAPRRPAPALPLFTASAFLNVTTSDHGWPENYFGYQPWHRLVQPADPDLPALPLTFTVAAADPHAAARQATAIGQRRSIDHNADYWPPQVRRLAVGDVVTITPHTPTTGPRRNYALAPGGDLTEVPCINEPLRLPHAHRAI
ncbi:hypothetical protein [Kitasatospora indigofera]|uniref:hypothetical protein n=1 Tax=Kitasatospora indigofera TaxID=67307 RepID=UPI0033A1603B